MAISIDWGTKIISVPQADLVLVETGVYELNLDTFRLSLKDLEDSDDGMVFPHTHSHTPPVTVGGVTLARVVEIINGYTVTFEDGQYAVNLAGANSNLSDVTNVNQVSVRAANSAGLTYSKQMEDLAFSGNKIWIDVDNGASGTAYPLGTSAYPVDNYQDARDIADARSLVCAFHVDGDLSINASHNLAENHFYGDSPLTSSINIASTVNTEQLTIEKLGVTGNLNGEVDLTECLLFDLDDFSGRAYNCGLSSTVTCKSGNLSLPIVFGNPRDATASEDTPIIDCGSGDVSVVIRDYIGSLKLTNLTANDAYVSLDVMSGDITVDASCNAGGIMVRGHARLIDESTGTCNVQSTSLFNLGIIAQPLNAQQVRDAMLLKATGNIASIDDKLDDNFSISAAGL